ncbi:cys-loop ligand-gated ion channel-like isoform X2 [Lineus longissimus]|uniref:cys-loop ligand-gated ion channel-like isoform X2 n=1 Tax=Lineus longissimus TaxID=88925 RepID=UPI002B4DA3B3
MSRQHNPKVSFEPGVSMAAMPDGTLEMPNGIEGDQDAAMKKQKKKLDKTWVKDTEETILQILKVLSKKVQMNTEMLQRLTGMGDYPMVMIDATDQAVGERVLQKDWIKRSDKVIVETRVVYTKIVDVDTVEQHFKAEVFLQARWEEPALDTRTNADLAKIHSLDNLWDPRVTITNIVGRPDDDDTWIVVTREECYNYPVITMRRRVKGFFSETLELKDFPLDVQELTLQIVSKRSNDEVELIEDRYRISAVNTTNFLDQDEWTLYKHVENATGDIQSEFTSSKHKHSTIFFTCSVRRNPGYFGWNIFLILFLLVSLMFCSFAIVPTNPQNRLTVTLTLLLTVVAFKFIVNQDLPAIPYLTYLDIYIVSCIVLLVLQAIQNAFITAFNGDPDKQEIVDKYTLYFLIACHLTFHLAFFLFIAIVAVKARTDCEEKDREYKERRIAHDKKRQALKHPADDDIYEMPA